MMATATATETHDTIILNVPDIRDESGALVAQADQVPVIQTDEDLTVANRIIRACADRKKQIEELFETCVKAAHAAHKALTSKRNEMLQPYLDLDRSIRARVNSYLQEQERKRISEQREREREARRIQEEQAAAEAAQLEAEGRTAEAEQVIEQAISAPPPVVLVAETPKSAMAGNKIRVSYDYKVDLAALVEAAAKNPGYRLYLMPDDRLIGQHVRQMKLATSIPGVTVKEIKGVTL